MLCGSVKESFLESSLKNHSDFCIVIAWGQFCEPLVQIFLILQNPMASFHLFLCSITFLLLYCIKSSQSAPTGFLLICPLMTQIYKNGFGGYIPLQWKTIAEHPSRSAESTSLLSMRVLVEGSTHFQIHCYPWGCLRKGTHISKSFILKWCHIDTSGIIVIILLSNLETESALFFSSN